MMPKISICIPCYNQVDNIKRLLNSILIQTYKDFEVIISDDSDNDLIKNCIEAYAINNIKYYKNAVALGSPANWNHAIDKASGDYIKIMHHDDWFTGEASLQAFVDVINKNPEVNFVVSHCVNVSTEREEIHDIPNLDMIRQTPDILYLGNHIGAPSVTFFRKSLLRFDNQLKWLVDIDFYIRMLRESTSMGVVTDPVISIGIHKNQITTSCRNNFRLNIFEYSYLYEKLNLASEKIFRDCLYEKLRWNHANTSDVINLEFPFFEKSKMLIQIYLKNLFTRVLK